MNRIMRSSGAALAAIFIAGSLTACGLGSASSSRSDINLTEVARTDLGKRKNMSDLWMEGPVAVDEALIAGFEAKYPNITITGQYDPDNVSGQNGPRVISAKDAPDIAHVVDMNSAVRGTICALEAAWMRTAGMFPIRRLNCIEWVQMASSAAVICTHCRTPIR